MDLIGLDWSGGAKHRVVTDFARMLPFTFKRRGSIWGYRRFYNGSSLETSDFLRDDCLKIYITVGVIISTLHSDFSIGSHIGMLLGNIEGSDITFNVSGEKFHAHKLILAARSTKFRSEFLEGVGTEGEEVMVQDIEPNVFKALLHFIYKDALAESELITSASCSALLVADTLTAKLLAAADRYDLKLESSNQKREILENEIASVIKALDKLNSPDTSAVTFEVLGHQLQFAQDPNSKHLGTTVWDASMVFAKFLVQRGLMTGFWAARHM